MVEEQGGMLSDPLPVFEGRGQRGTIGSPEEGVRGEP